MFNKIALKNWRYPQWRQYRSSFPRNSKWPLYEYKPVFLLLGNQFIQVPCQRFRSTKRRNILSGVGAFSKFIFKWFKILLHFAGRALWNIRSSHSIKISLRGKIRAKCKGNKTIPSCHAMFWCFDGGRCPTRDVSGGAAIVLEQNSFNGSSNGTEVNGSSWNGGQIRIGIRFQTTQVSNPMTINLQINLSVICSCVLTHHYFCSTEGFLWYKK